MRVGVSCGIPSGRYPGGVYDRLEYHKSDVTERLYFRIPTRQRRNCLCSKHLAYPTGGRGVVVISGPSLSLNLGA